MTPIHLRGEYWVKALPEGAQDPEIEISVEDEFYQLSYLLENLDEESGFYGEWMQHSVDLPPGSWQIVCLSKEVTEEVAKELVDSSQWYFPERHTRYVDYDHPFDREFKQRWSEGFATAKESFPSFLRSKGLDINNTLILKKVDMATKKQPPTEKQIAEWKAKADKWDALDKKIAKYYAEPDDEDYDKSLDESGLIGIGEAAAIAFGYL